jgi:hypothetical protein
MGHGIPAKQRKFQADSAVDGRHAVPSHEMNRSSP